MSRQGPQQHAVGDAPKLDRPVVAAGGHGRPVRRIGDGRDRDIVAAAHPEDVRPLGPAGHRRDRQPQHTRTHDERRIESTLSHDWSSGYG